MLTNMRDRDVRCTVSNQNHTSESPDDGSSTLMMTLGLFTQIGTNATQMRSMIKYNIVADQ